MQLWDKIASYKPQHEQEINAQAVILEAMHQFPQNILLRENKLAHLTSSGFVLNPALDKAVLIHHNILNTWAWTGGHADGNADLLAVALRESAEETGAVGLKPLSKKIAALDILPVPAHFKNGRYVNAHLHLSVAYLLVCEEGQQFKIKPDENSDVRWFSEQEFTPTLFGHADFSLYCKLFKAAHQL